MTPPDDTKLEAETREEIDEKLMAAGWIIQDKKRINLYESLGVAVREMDTDTGPADYMLFIDGIACGIIEAKREGTELGGVAEQSARYATSQTKHIERWVPDDQPLPFLYEATNHEIRFRDERDPHPRSRFVFHFHKPETLKEWLEEGGTITSLLINTINIAPEYHPVMPDLIRDPVGEQRRNQNKLTPRYKVRVAFGKRAEAWVIGVEKL